MLIQERNRFFYWIFHWIKCVWSANLWNCWDRFDLITILGLKLTLSHNVSIMKLMMRWFLSSVTLTTCFALRNQEGWFESNFLVKNSQTIVYRTCQVLSFILRFDDIYVSMKRFCKWDRDWIVDISLNNHKFNTLNLFKVPLS